MTLHTRWLRPLALSASCLVASATVQAQEIVLKVGHFLPGMSLAQRGVLEPWCAELGQATQGRVKCQFFPSMSLGGTPAQLPDQVKNGVADIVWTAPGYSTGRFPRTEALELPGVLPQGGAAQGKVTWPFFDRHLREEYKDFQVLAMHGDGGMNVHTSKQAIRSADDLKGLKLRAPNRTLARTLQAFGASPVAMPPAQMTEAIAKGVVDGASAVWEVILPTKLDEVTRFHMDTPDQRPVLGATVLVVLMNKARYQALPADVRAALDRLSGPALVDRFGQAWDKASAAARDKVTQAGHTLTRLDDVQYGLLRQRAASVEASWLEDMKGKGVDGAALLKSARALNTVSRP